MHRVSIEMTMQPISSCGKFQIPIRQHRHPRLFLHTEFLAFLPPFLTKPRDNLERLIAMFLQGLLNKRL